MAYCILRSTKTKGCKYPLNWSIARPKYEIYVIKISVSPEERKMDFLNFPQGLKVFPNLFLCVYFLSIST